MADRRFRKGSLAGWPLAISRYSQTSSQECVLQRTTFANVRYMRRRWNISLSWKPHYRRLFSAMAFSYNRATSLPRAVRTISITRQVLISPEGTYRLRSLWLTGDLEHSALWCTDLPMQSKRPDPFSFFNLSRMSNRFGGDKMSQAIGLGLLSLLQSRLVFR